MTAPYRHHPCKFPKKPYLHTTNYHYKQMTHCLNCQKPLTDAFCAGCGQKADTHRISFKHFIFHDVLHGTLHLERGILFTARQALVRPGQAALDYISGKRKPYYNVFYLVLLTIGLQLFVRHGYDWLVDPNPQEVQLREHLNTATQKLDAIFSQKSKIILLLFVPFAALNSFILFRRKKLNLSEHAILAGMILLGILLVSIMGHLLFFVNLLVQMSNMVLSMVVTAAIVGYIGFAYVNAFKDDYSRWEVGWRTVLFFVLILLEIFLLMLLLIGYVTDWKFTAVNVAPFG